MSSATQPKSIDRPPAFPESASPPHTEMHRELAVARRSSPGCVDQRPAAWVGAQCLEVDHEATGLGSSRGSTRGVCLHLGQTEIAGQREVDTPGEDQLPSSGPSSGSIPCSQYILPKPRMTVAFPDPLAPEIELVQTALRTIPSRTRQLPRQETYCGSGSISPLASDNHLVPNQPPTSHTC